MTAFQLVASRGSVLVETSQQGTTVRRIVFNGPASEWETIDLPKSEESATSHMLAVLRGEAKPIADEDDSRATLAACFAFYRAAQEHRLIEL
jgi:hypothetical protein